MYKLNISVGEIWLGTDPLLVDSDRYNWMDLQLETYFLLLGMEYLWLEVHFGIDYNSSALTDEDLDGWDDLDGIISPDVSRTGKIGHQY